MSEADKHTYALMPTNTKPTSQCYQPISTTHASITVLLANKYPKNLTSPFQQPLC